MAIKAEERIPQILERAGLALSRSSRPSVRRVGGEVAPKKIG
jgi:hypothetical protein